MGLFTNPLGYAGYPPGAGGTPTTLNSTVRAATAAEAATGTLTNCYISPATADSATALDFASPPVDGFGSTTPRPVHATTLDSTLNTLLATSASATAAAIANVAPSAARTGDYHGGNSAQNDTVTWLGGNPSANTQTLRVFSGAPSGGTQTVGFFTGNATGGTQSFNLLTGTRAGTVNIGTGAAAHTLNLGSSTALVGFFGATAATKTGNTNDIKDSLVSYGLVTDGGATPLNLDSGALTCGALTAVGTININSSGAAVTTIGTGGTGATNIGNATGNTAVTGSLTASTTLTATLGAITATNGNLVLNTAGNKVSIATGANASIGTSEAMTAGSVTISTTAVTASSKIFLTANTPGGTQGELSAPTASIVAGTSFVINSSSNTDTSTVNWWIVN